MKKLLSILLLLLIVCGCGLGALIWVTPPPPTPPMIAPPPPSKAVSAALIDGNTGEVLADKEGSLRIYPASTTKILTCIIALEEGKAKLDQNAVISPRAMAQDGTNIGLRPDMPLSLHQLLYGMMLISGNDAAVSVAETVGGSYGRFIEMMNEKAASIGVHDSHFANPNGLTNPNHYTTAYDMAKIAAYAMKNPDFRDIVKRPSYPMTYRNGVYRNVENRNEFLTSHYEGANGVKTGMTEAAGDCLVASAERDGRLMIVALYDDTDRWKEARTWLDYGFAEAEKKAEYERKLAAEPKVYKLVNQLLGRSLVTRRRKSPFLVRLFPHSPFLRVLFVIVVLLSLYIVLHSGYHFYQIRQQETLLLEEKERLSKEKAELSQKREDLKDDGQLEKKARQELGLVKPGEVPYVR